MDRNEHSYSVASRGLLVYVGCMHTYMTELSLAVRLVDVTGTSGVHTVREGSASTGAVCLDHIFLAVAKIGNGNCKDALYGVW
jgi:hypothetical protein